MVFSGDIPRTHKATLCYETPPGGRRRARYVTCSETFRVGDIDNLEVIAAPLRKAMFDTTPADILAMMMRGEGESIVHVATTKEDPGLLKLMAVYYPPQELQYT